MRQNKEEAAAQTARTFCVWLRAVLDAIDRHKKDQATEEARQRSGNTKFQHGLTREQEAEREELRAAKREFHRAKGLDQQFKAKS